MDKILFFSSGKLSAMIIFLLSEILHILFIKYTPDRKGRMKIIPDFEKMEYTQIKLAIKFGETLPKSGLLASLLKSVPEILLSIINGITIIDLHQLSRSMLYQPPD